MDKVGGPLGVTVIAVVVALVVLFAILHETGMLEHLSQLL